MVIVRKNPKNRWHGAKKAIKWNTGLKGRVLAKQFLIVVICMINLIAVKYLRPKLLEHRRFYSSATKTDLNNKYSLNPSFITGFIDGEGSFIVSILKNPRYNTGWEVQASFSISLHKKDLALLKQIQAYFGGAGSITKEREDSLHYRVRSTLDLTNVIISHLDKYPLLTQKKADFLLFKQVVDLINRKEHLTPSGLQQIVNIRASINKGLSSNLKVAFANTLPVQRPFIQNQIIPDPATVVGPPWNGGGGRSPPNLIE